MGHDFNGETERKKKLQNDKEQNRKRIPIFNSRRPKTPGFV